MQGVMNFRMEDVSEITGEKTPWRSAKSQIGLLRGNSKCTRKEFLNLSISWPLHRRGLYARVQIPREEFFDCV